jgi:hypothetical protein
VDAEVLLLRSDVDPSDRDVTRGGRRLRVRDGVTTLEELEPGRYVVAASLDRLTVAVRTSVDIHGGATRVELVVPPPDPSKYVIARVLGPRGDPLDERDVRIAPSYYGPQIVASGGGVVSRRGDGDWMVGHHPAAAMYGASGGTWALEVTSPKYGVLQRRYDPAADDRLEFRFAEPARVEIQLDGYVGSSLQGRLMVTPQPAPELDRRGHRGAPGVQFSEDGRVVVDPIQPGPYVLLLILRGDKPEDGSAVIERLPFVVRPGRTSVRLPIPERRELVVRAPTRDPSLRLGLERIDEAGNWIVRYRKPDEDGALRFPELPDGEYDLFGRWAGSERRIRVNLPAQTAVTLK